MLLWKKKESLQDTFGQTARDRNYKCRKVHSDEKIKETIFFLGKKTISQRRSVQVSWKSFDNTKGTKSRIAMAKEAFTKKRALLTS